MADSIEDWYAQYDLPGGDLTSAPNYYYSEDDDPGRTSARGVFVSGASESYREDPLDCAACGHTHPESLDERGRCPYCR
jgi:hypothetical protein